MILRRELEILLVLLVMASAIYSCSSPKADARRDSSKAYSWEKPIQLTAKENALAYSIDTFFQRKVKHAGFNGSILVANEGRIIYQKSFGYAEYKSKKLLNDSATFQLASTSKPFTATAVLMLYEHGKISLDDPVSKYLNGFPYDSITIRMLLSHRSGLANYIYLFDSVNIAADSFITNQEVVDYFVDHQPPLQSTPGHHFQYCNSNYALLASVIEKVSGQSYEEFLNENIFQPSHMYHTFVKDAKNPVAHDNETAAYLGAEWKRVPPVPTDGVVGDKGIYSTPYDLYLFDQALDHNILLTNETLNEAYRGYSHEKPGVRNYGLGWRIKEFPNGEKLIYHNGWWRGYNSLFDRRPDRGICIVVLSNKYNRNAYDVSGLFDLLHITDGDSGDE